MQSVSGAERCMDELSARRVSVWSPIRSRSNISPSRRPKTSSRRSTTSWTPASQRRVEDDGSRRRRSCDPDIQLTATCVRVPVFIRSLRSGDVEFERHITRGRARAILARAPGVTRRRQAARMAGYATPVDCAGEGRRRMSVASQGRRQSSMAVSVDRRRQSAQGCGAECVADRRMLVNRKLLRKAA